MTQEFVTLPREVVKLALESMDESYADTRQGRALADVLRAALEQPQNHVPDAGNMAQAGWKLVPVEPTREMLDAARKDLVRDAEIDPMLKGIHSAILDAAPQPPVIEQKAKPACEQDEAIYLSIAANYTQQPPGPAYLLRDLADDISVDAVDLIAAIRDAGLGNYSINMKLPTRVCVAMCQKFSDAQQPQVEQEPVAWIENVEGGIGYNPYHEAARKLPDGVRFDLYAHPQNLRCKSTQKRLATLWGYVKAGQLQGEQEICCKIWSVNHIDDLGKIVDSSGRLIATVYGSQADTIVACHNSHANPQPKREPLSTARIDELIEEGIFGGNPYELVRRLEEERGVFMTRPLTDEQIDRIIADLAPVFLDTPTGFEEDFCRAIEAAHNIK